MSLTTQEQMLDTARDLFAERGFYGVSIANIVDEHGLTKQALLHHFGSKEKVYGEVLKRISEELALQLETAQSSADDEVLRFKNLFLNMKPKQQADASRMRLLMRELLDNPVRAEKAGVWYLGTFLNDLIKMTKALPGWQKASDAQALSLVYQLLGAVAYFSISHATLRGIFGDRKFNAISRSFPRQLDTLIDAAIANPPATRTSSR